MQTIARKGKLVLKDGSVYEGELYGIPDALDVPHICVQVRHGITSRLANYWSPLYNGAGEKTRRWAHGHLEEVGGPRSLMCGFVRRDDRGWNRPVAPGTHWTSSSDDGCCGAGPVEQAIQRCSCALPAAQSYRDRTSDHPSGARMGVKSCIATFVERCFP